MRAPLALGLALAVLPACINTTPAGTHLATDPPGALIVVDGKESGYVTPAVMHLSEGRDHTVRLELPGYVPATLAIDENRRITFVPWFKGTTSNSSFVFPSFLPWYDFWAPMRVNNALSPSRVFVELIPTDGGPGDH